MDAACVIIFERQKLSRWIRAAIYLVAAAAGSGAASAAAAPLNADVSGIRFALSRAQSAAPRTHHQIQPILLTRPLFIN